MPLLVDRQAMRALFHAVPPAEEEVAQIKWDSSEFTLGILDRANVVLSQLRLNPSAFAEGLKDSFEIRVLAKHLRGALNTCIREDLAQAVKVELSALANGLQVRVITPPNKTSRKLGRDSSGPIKMTSLPKFDNEPSITGLPPTVLDDGLTALALLDLDYIVLQVSGKGVKMEAFPEMIPAFFEHSVASETKTGKSRVSEGHLRTVADFGARHGVQPLSLGIALIPDGLMRYSYELENGAMTFWVAPRATED